MERIRLILIFLFSFILYCSDKENQEWILKIFFDVKGGWNFNDGEKGSYELKILFQGWLFRDNGDFGISFTRDSKDGSIYYWKIEKEKDGKKTDLTTIIKPDFKGGVSIRDGNENLILLRIFSSVIFDYPLVFPSSMGFGIIEKTDDYDRFIVSGSNKLSFRDEDLKKEFNKKTEWEWRKTSDRFSSFHKVKTFMVIKPYL